MEEVSGTPYVSLKRTYMILLIVYVLAAVFGLLAGAALTWHVDPFSECILFSHNFGGKLYYGHEAICETIAYLYLGCVIGAIVMFYITFKHRREFLHFFNSGNFTKSEQLLTVNQPIIQGHVVLTVAICILTVATTSGYGIACNNIGEKMEGSLRSKLSQDPNKLSGEKIDERFDHDNQFWRYTAEIKNPYGQNLYAVRMTCRTVLTDPQVHQELHDNHVDNYNNYYGYWYEKDLFGYNSRQQATLQNALIEATLAGGWVSVLLWVGSIVFILIQRFYIRREKNKFERFTPSEYMNSVRKEGSMISGYYSGNGNMSNFQRGGLRGSNQSMKSIRSRRDMDDMAFASLGIPSNTGTLTSGYNSQVPYQDTPAYPVDQGQFIRQQQGLMMSAPVHYSAQQYGGEGRTYLQPQDNMETEIM